VKTLVPFLTLPQLQSIVSLGQHNGTRRPREKTAAVSGGTWPMLVLVGWLTK
jgi:hypothetical protein